MWVGVLSACAEWGCPPWEILEGNKAIWLLRYFLYKKEMQKGQDALAKVKNE